MPDSIEALIGFSKRDSDPVTGNEVFVPGYLDNPVVTERCRILDARKHDISFERDGFELIHQPTAYADERDKAVLRVGYLDEGAAFLKQHFGAKLVVPSRHALLIRLGKRLINRAKPEGDVKIIDDQIPATFMHLDYLPESCAGQAASNSAREGLSEISYSRLMMIQTWRAISSPPQDSPLTICDPHTLGENNFTLRTGVLAPHNAPGSSSATFQIDCVHYDPAQKWYYYPWMKPEELLLMTGFDSGQPDGGRVAHGAFDNRPNEPDAHERESIEARYWVYFD